MIVLSRIFLIYPPAGYVLIWGVQFRSAGAAWLLFRSAANHGPAPCKQGRGVKAAPIDHHTGPKAVLRTGLCDTVAFVLMPVRAWFWIKSMTKSKKGFKWMLTINGGQWRRCYNYSQFFFRKKNHHFQQLASGIKIRNPVPVYESSRWPQWQNQMFTDWRFNGKQFTTATFPHHRELLYDHSVLQLVFLQQGGIVLCPTHLLILCSWNAIKRTTNTKWFCVCQCNSENKIINGNLIVTFIFVNVTVKVTNKYRKLGNCEAHGTHRTWLDGSWYRHPVKALLRCCPKFEQKRYKRYFFVYSCHCSINNPDVYFCKKRKCFPLLLVLGSSCSLNYADIQTRRLPLTKYSRRCIS